MGVSSLDGCLECQVANKLFSDISQGLRLDAVVLWEMRGRIPVWLLFLEPYMEGGSIHVGQEPQCLTNHFLFFRVKFLKYVIFGANNGYRDHHGRQQLLVLGRHDLV